MTWERSNEPEVYISVDIEASGPIPGEYSMLSFGACVVGRPELSIYKTIRPLTMDFVPEALSISGLSMADLTATGIPAQVAMVEFRDWIANVSSGRAPVFVGFNAVFDWCFINWYFHKFLRANPFGFGGIDIKSYYMGLTGATWEQSRSSRLKDEYQPEHQQTHNALDDARSQAEIFHKMLQTEQQRRASP